MVSEDIFYLPIRQLAEQIRTRKLSCVELTQGYVERSKRFGPRYNAYVTITEELALTQARAADEEISSGHYRGPLHGIPYAAKDLLAVKGYKTTWGAKPYADQSFDYNATVIERLNRAGAVLIGKAAMIELAGGLGYSGANASLTGPCKNPWNTDYWTCGSSSGSGAIVAAGLANFALGSDTRGSIICPSTLCGISGMRPSFGRVSRHGVMAIAWSMDKIGPMARTADCCGTVLSAIAGHDPEDHDSLPSSLSAFDYRMEAQSSGRPLRIARLTNVFPDADPILHSAVDDALKVLEKNGARISDAELPEGPYEEAAELVILIEAASAFSELIQSGRCAQLEDPLGQINGYASLEFSAADLLQVQRVRVSLQQKIDALFERFDVIAAPGEDSISIPLKRSARLANPPESAKKRPLPRRGNSMQPDAISSLCGLPAVTVPCAFTKDGFPVGIQFIARALNDYLPIAAATLFQAHTDWHTKHPQLAS